MTEPWGRPDPPASEAAAPYWEATRDQRLVLQWCTACDAPVFYPREICPGCLGSEFTWREAAGTGTVYAVTVEYRPQLPALADRAPYAVALVELDEGVRLLTNVVECDPERVAVGDRVTVTWEPLADGRHLPLFRPAAG